MAQTDQVIGTYETCGDPQHSKPPMGNGRAESGEQQPLLPSPSLIKDKTNGAGFTMARLLVSTDLWISMLAATMVASLFSALEAVRVTHSNFIL